MAQDQGPFIGEIILYAGKSLPHSLDWAWHLCDGSRLKKADYVALHALLGSTYGPEDSEYFVLPDMRGRVPIHLGHGPDLSKRVLGEKGGTEEVTLNSEQLGRHNHKMLAAMSSVVAGVQNGVMANANIYSSSESGLKPLDDSSVTTNPQTAAIAHENCQPSLALNFYIRTIGIYPRR